MEGMNILSVAGSIISTMYCNIDCYCMSVLARIYRILTGGFGGKKVFNNDDHYAHCKKMFKEVEMLFKTEGFSSDVGTHKNIKYVLINKRNKYVR